MTKPILQWPGGKRRLLGKLLPMIPQHACYVEVFAGGLAVMLAKEPSKNEVINDLNGQLTNLYRCVQWHLEPLIAEFQWVVYSRETLASFRREPGLTDIQRAARFLAVNRSSFAGNCTTFAVSKTTPRPARTKVIEMLRSLNERLDRVLVENLPWQRCVDLYDSPSSFLFLDPPYVNAPTGAYAGFTETQMTELAARLKTTEGNWICTTNDSPFTRELFAEWPQEAVQTRNQLGTGDRKFGELIIAKIGEAKR